MKKSVMFAVCVCIGFLVMVVTSCGSASSNATQEVAQETEQMVVDEKPMELAQLPKDMPVAADTDFKPFKIYTDRNSPDNHFIPSGYMGDYSDVKVDLACFDSPKSGSTCVKITYRPDATQGARWAGIYWQNPANNWGERDGGFDLTGAKKLVFWARGEVGGERIEEFKMGGVTGTYSDSDSAGIGPVLLTAEWKEYVIDLTDKDLSYVIGGFCWATNLDVNPNGATFYLDDIRYE